MCDKRVSFALFFCGIKMAKFKQNNSKLTPLIPGGVGGEAVRLSPIPIRPKGKDGD